MHTGIYNYVDSMVTAVQFWRFRILKPREQVAVRGLPGTWQACGAAMICCNSMWILKTWMSSQESQILSGRD